MRRVIPRIVLSPLLAWSALAGPTTQPDAAPAPAFHYRTLPKAPYPAAFQILQTRSIFARGGTAGGAGPGAPAASPLQAMALRGVVRDEEGRYTAIVEETTTHQVQSLAEGSPLAGGHVSGISLHGLRFDLGGKSVAVAVGENLTGQATAALVAQAPATQPGEAAQAGPEAAAQRLSGGVVFEMPEQTVARVSARAPAAAPSSN